MVGTICERKNQIGLIKYLNKVGSDYHIDMYGNCEHNFTQQFNGLSNCKYKGIQNNSSINILFSNYDVLISNSYDECLPYSILEAMLNNVVVISTNCGGICEIISNGIDGYIYDVGDYDKLMLILNILRHYKQNLKKIAQNARKQIITNFNLLNSVKQHVQLCNELFIF